MGNWSLFFFGRKTQNKRQFRGSHGKPSSVYQLRLETLENRWCPSVTSFLDPNPSPGNGFGSTLLPLSSGNVVLTAPFDDAGGEDAGAVYLFHGSTGKLISTLRGSTPGDRVGSGGVWSVGNGNFLVGSPAWNHSGVEFAGAVTWGDGMKGVSGIVSELNSLVGTTTHDQIGSRAVVFPNGNFLVVSPFWSNGTEQSVGAITWGHGNQGVFGPVSANNSLVGSTQRDSDGQWIRVLANGNALVLNPFWDNGSAGNAGAVTWMNSSKGLFGQIGPANSLIGASPEDTLGFYGSRQTVFELSNGHVVVLSPNWDSGFGANVGAATWLDGTQGLVGTISTENSLIGSTPEDRVGSQGIVDLKNGNFLVRSPLWDHGLATDAGAVTWVPGDRGLAGIVGRGNSLVGSSPGDLVGNWDTGPYSGWSALLPQGNYMVGTPTWDNGSGEDAGAWTWIDGKHGITGELSPENSLVGSASGDRVGGLYNEGFIPLDNLPNGNLVVRSPYWSNGSAQYAGAVTWVDGRKGIRGVLSSSNSLVGSRQEDFVGFEPVVPLTNGNYAVPNPYWARGDAEYAGAVTWADGKKGVSGPISETNSLVGTHPQDRVGTSVVPLTNGNYTIISPYWDRGSLANAGAVTLANGRKQSAGFVSESNSLVGSSINDFLDAKITSLSNGHFVIATPRWDNGSATDAGAVTWADGFKGITGTLDANKSLVGTSANDSLSDVKGLPNGNYLVLSPDWDRGTAVDAGAVTWGDGKKGVKGRISPENSLVGSTSGDRIGDWFLQATGSDSFLVVSTHWTNTNAANAGAVTFGDGKRALKGVVSPSNSLVGSQGGDRVGTSLTALPSGNFVVVSSNWSRGQVQGAGAVTWVDGKKGAFGPVDATNSLVGTRPGDAVGYMGITVLPNGNYLVKSPYWDNGLGIKGAITWGNGSRGISGTINLANSLINLGLVNSDLQISSLKSGYYLVHATGTSAPSQPPNGLSVALDGGKPSSGTVLSNGGIQGTQEFPFGGSPILDNLKDRIFVGYGTRTGGQSFLMIDYLPRKAAITSPSRAETLVGNPINFPIMAEGNPKPTIQLVGSLPRGLTFDSTLGIIKGTPAPGTEGRYRVTITASNGVGGRVFQSLNLRITSPPRFPGGAQILFTAGKSQNARIVVTGFPKPILSMEGTLPPGMTFHADTGLLSGTPPAGMEREFTLVVTATNGVGSPVKQPFKLTVGTPPRITSSGQALFTPGESGAFRIMASGFPGATLIVVGSLPEGISFQSQTGTLMGIPGQNSQGTYKLVVLATNALGSTRKDLKLIVQPQPIQASAKGQIGFNDPKPVENRSVESHPSFDLIDGSIQP